MKHGLKFACDEFVMEHKNYSFHIVMMKLKKKARGL